MHAWYMGNTAVISVIQTEKYHQMGQEDNTEPPKGIDYSYCVYNNSSDDSSGSNVGRGVQRPIFGRLNRYPQV